MKVLSIFGTRPEAIKMAPVVKALESTAGIESKVAVTAQHREMLDQVLTLFNIKPDFDLDTMKANQDLFDITSRILMGLRSVLNECKPDLVLVHGDTTTCFAAGLAAFYLGIPVGHVEAGLRTGDMKAPFPEEANRNLVGRLAQFHFAPTEGSKSNLLAENIDKTTIHVTGNTVIDALLKIQSTINDYTPADWPSLPNKTISAIQNKPQRLILITGHRRENFGQGFIDFCTALQEIAQHNPNWLLVYPVHLNPNVQKPVFEMLHDSSNIHLIAPQDYLPFVWLLDKCDLVITDSGGIQEEAPSLGKPVLVTREVTERPEAVTAGTVKLVGTCPDKIVKNALSILTDTKIYSAMSEAHNPYGDGQAAQRIVNVILGMKKA
ncbi:UDP-N-acetylglucosamine 2-epimerase [Gammaproteobacteria bacterium 42_54_T18]|nr:UDP-N-acetylglucosamine 2-epimerase [Gammaproteobacteria bacterium 42_54_T18]